MEKLIDKVNRRNSRLVAPLIGFPGIKLVDGSIKLAQQNHILHFSVIEAIYNKFRPDIIFPMMDLSLEANALGKLARFPKNKPAAILNKKLSVSEYKMMQNIDVTADARIRSYVETIKMMCEKLPKEVIKAAYVTAPFTLASMIKGVDDIALAISGKPDKLLEIISFCSEVILTFTKALIDSGAELICILDPMASLLNVEIFTEFSGNFIKPIVKLCEQREVHSVLHICGNTMGLLEKMEQTGVDGLSLDSEDIGIDLLEVASSISENLVIFGNICPTGKILSGTIEEVDTEVMELMKKMEAVPNFIISTGCDLPLEVPLKNIAAFMKATRKM